VPGPAPTGREAPSEVAPAAPVARKGKDPLLAGICHDLRAPLAAVMMGANFVFQTTPDDESTARSRRVLAAMLRSCKQMERLIRDFGDLSEIEGDTVELRVNVHDAGELLELAAEGARTEAAAHDVTITIQPPPATLHVTCDRDRLLRALGHVVDNAVRFSSAGGEVSLTAAAETNGEVNVRFSVTDHGPGISEETMAHLYERAWHTKQPTRSGAGLGLAIARGMVRAHGGRLEVDTGPAGTSVDLVVPKDAPLATPEPDLHH
jgi:signal transduction histidine kinase